MTVKEIIKTANNSSIAMIEYIEQIPKNFFSYTLELIDEIEIARYNKDDNLLESLLIIASRDGVDSRFTNILCELLKEDWHYSHEDIVMILEEIKDPLCIETLYETAINIPDYDDGRSLAKKCIWALGTINTPEGIEKLKMLKEADDPIIKEAAIMELQHNAK